MQNIINNTRDIISDASKYTSDTFEYLTSKVFTLSESNVNYVDAASITCYKNGSLYASSNYSFNTVTGKITVTGTITLGDILEFIYYCYEKYSDNEIRGYIRAALIYLSVEKYGVFSAKVDNIIFPTPSEEEENLIALIASILIKPPLSSYKTPEITINFVEKMSKEEKIKQAVRQFSKTIGILKYIKMTEEEDLDTETTCE